MLHLRVFSHHHDEGGYSPQSGLPPFPLPGGGCNGSSTITSSPSPRRRWRRRRGVKPTQLRKDLTYFGQFGTRGLGYDVAALSKKLDEVLGTTRLQPVILAGAGNLGTALLGYNEGFAKEGFEIVATFDAEPRRRRVGSRTVDVRPIAQLATFIQEQSIKMAIVAVPGHGRAGSRQWVGDRRDSGDPELSRRSSCRCRRTWSSTTWTWPWNSKT